VVDAPARLRGLQRGAVAAVVDHRVVGVGAADDPRLERDVVAGDAVGVAAAVPPLVGRAHRRAEVLEARGHAEDLLALDRVAAHDVALEVVQRAVVVEDRGVDRQLSDVVEDRDELTSVHDIASSPIRSATQRASFARRWLWSAVGRWWARISAASTRIAFRTRGSSARSALVTVEVVGTA
jgi:hypothetical protein